MNCFHLAAHSSYICSHKPPEKMSKKHFLDDSRIKTGTEISFWVVFCLIYASLYANYYSLTMSLARAMVNMVPLIALFYINLRMVDRFFEKSLYLPYILRALVWLAVVAWIRVLANQWFPEIQPRQIIAEKPNGLWVVAIATNLLALLISSFYAILEIRFRNERRNQEIIRQQNEAQIQFLRAQINPHFLFNILNNIYALAIVHSDRTADMVMHLSRLMRFVVYDTQAPQIPLEREIAHIHEFIELFRMRSESPLDIQFQVNGNPEGVWLEPMLLIPLVENCCKHCDFDLNPTAFIRIELRIEDAKLEFHTQNTYNPTNQQKDQVGGVGLENIRRRLELQYQHKYQLHIHPEQTLHTAHLTLILE